MYPHPHCNVSRCFLTLWPGSAPLTSSVSATCSSTVMWGALKDLEIWMECAGIASFWLVDTDNTVLWLVAGRTVTAPGARCTWTTTLPRSTPWLMRLDTTLGQNMMVVTAPPTEAATHQRPWVSWEDSRLRSSPPAGNTYCWSVDTCNTDLWLVVACQPCITGCSRCMLRRRRDTVWPCLMRTVWLGMI